MGCRTEFAGGDKKQGEAPCIVVHCNLYSCIYGMLETFE
jgi:hypothetical protein